MKCIPESEMERLFKKAAELGVGIEINGGDLVAQIGSPVEELTVNMFKIAKKQGCKFYFGTDAHSEAGYRNAAGTFERMVDLLELTEDDKFRL